MASRFRDMLESPTARRRALDAMAVVLAVVCAVIAFSAAAKTNLTVGPARLQVSLSPVWSPRTVVAVPPFGSVEAPTHAGPVLVQVQLLELDFVGAGRMIESGEISPATISSATAEDLPDEGLADAAWRLMLGGLAAAGLVAALVALALRRRRSVVALAVAISLAVPAASVGIAYATYHAAAFREPTLRGGLSYAPQLVDVFSTRIADIERLRDQAVKVARDLAAYYADERSLTSGGALPGTYRVLHITDLHLDPVGAELGKEVARSFEASLVIDTGDLPILGASIEAATFASLVDTSVPRVYIPGNHDSPASIAELERLGVTVLTSGIIELDGLSIFGVPDPVSRGFGVEPDRDAVEASAEDAFAELEAAIRSGDDTPQVVAIHNPAMERPFLGSVPLILSGHTHSARFYVSKGTARLNSGTLGGMPYDPDASGRKALPYSASVLYFTAEMPRRLIAIDRIAIHSRRSTTVSREVIDESLLP